MREQRKQIAQETLKIQQQGFYTTASNRVDISTAQRHSEDASRLITPEEGEALLQAQAPPYNYERVVCEISNISTVEAVINSVRNGKKTAALNFASAKNPGGGFLNGAMAQEEALAISSGLYNTLLKHPQMYEANRKCGTMMYTDHAIYSPDVVFFRDASLKLLAAPVAASILTLPAVNMKQVGLKGENVTKAQQIMKRRMRLALEIFAQEEVQTLILGAYGCGVFGNNPHDIAAWWKSLLIEEMYGHAFEKVLFAILGDPVTDRNIRAFEGVFG